MKVEEDLDSFDELKKKILQTLKQIDPLFSISFSLHKTLLFFSDGETQKMMSVSFVFFSGGEKWVAHLQLDPLK